MSFGIADIIAVIVIEDGLKHLAAHPEHLNFILSPMLRHRAIRDYVGTEHVARCVDWVTKNQIYVAPYYEADLTKVPSLVTISRHSETQQFLGEMGKSHVQMNAVLPPIVCHEFTISGISEDRTTLYVAEDLHVEKFLWPRLWLVNGDFKGRIDYINVQEGQPTQIGLKDVSVPERTSFTGWKAQSGDRHKGYDLHASQDSVEVNIKLTTTGDYSVHRLMSIVTRYCLKRGHLLFDYYGLQTPKVSQSMPVKEEEQNQQFSTVFTVSGLLTEHWIVNEFETGDGSGRLDLEMVAESEGQASVKLE